MAAGPSTLCLTETIDAIYRLMQQRSLSAVRRKTQYIYDLWYKTLNQLF